MVVEEWNQKKIGGWKIEEDKVVISECNYYNLQILQASFNTNLLFCYYMYTFPVQTFSLYSQGTNY